MVSYFLVRTGKIPGKILLSTLSVCHDEVLRGPYGSHSVGVYTCILDLIDLYGNNKKNLLSVDVDVAVLVALMQTVKEVILSCRLNRDTHT